MTRPAPPDERIVNELLARAVPGALGAERMVSSGAAAVYRVVDPALTSVVVKIVPSEIARRVTSLHREVGRTPGLLGLLRAGGAGDFGYLVFPHLGESLADRIEAQPMSGGELARILSDVADGLSRLHRLGYVHGDIKPGNILMTADGTATLTDLDDVAAAGTAPLRITPGFCAPEQFTGASSAPAADLYALAAVVLTALTGTTRWMADPSAALAPGSLPAVTGAAADGLRADLSADPAARTVGPTELMTLLRQPPSTVPSAVAAPVPGTRLDPVPAPAPRVAAPPAPVSTPGPSGRPRHAASEGSAASSPVRAPERTVTDVASPLRRDHEGGDELLVAARRAWGFVDLRAATVDRLPLQIVPEPDPIDDEPPDRAIWRRPAMIVSLIVAVLLIVTGLLLAFVF